MRLICPNCSAQYEVDANLIPEEGRDVQCSNCGNTWFELPAPVAEPSEAAEPDVAGSDEELDTSKQVTRLAHEPKVAAKDTSEKSDAEDTSKQETKPASSETQDGDKGSGRDETLEKESVEEDDEWIETAPAPAAQKRPKDVAAVDVLKEEATREMAQRENRNLTRLETQGEFGLDAVKGRDTPSRALRARMARMKNEDMSKTDAPDASDYSAPRRDLLPDIEEINSSLGPAGGKTGPLEAQALAHQRGFRYGFFLTVLLALIAIVTYAWAPAIAAAVPGSEGPLITYVDWANNARDAFNQLIGQGGS